MRTDTLVLPAFLAPALINGDTSGMEDSDIHWLEATLLYIGPGRIVSCGDSFFAWSCDLPGFKLGADMCEYTVLYAGE